MCEGCCITCTGPGRANEHIDPHLVAGFGDPAELEPERRADGSRDVRRLARLLTQPLAALAGPGYDKPVWHCAVRAAPGDRVLSDAEWAQVAALVMDRTGLAAAEDEGGVRWVAVRHAADHVHLVATLARQDGAGRGSGMTSTGSGRPARPRSSSWGWPGLLRRIAPRPGGRRGRRPSRRPGGAGPRRRGSGCAGRCARRRPAAGSEEEFFARLDQAGVLVRRRYSTVRPGEVTGYAVGPGRAHGPGWRGDLVRRREARG